MKFGHEYETALANEGYPEEWVQSAIDYKQLKKLIKRVHRELRGLGLDEHTLAAMNDLVAQPKTPLAMPADDKEYFSAANPHLSSIQEEFVPQLKVLVDRKTRTPLDARLAPETKDALQRLAKHEMVVEGRRQRLEQAAEDPPVSERKLSLFDEGSPERQGSTSPEYEDATWVYLPLASAKDFFEMLEPKLSDLDAIRDAETKKLEDEILDLGDMVEDVVMPVKEGYEATRDISHRDLYFWREMFRLYLENPIFYRETEKNRGAIKYIEAKQNLADYDNKIRETGLLAKMKTPQAKAAAKQFFEVNLQILKVMHFQEMQARAMRKILKKFDKQTHLQGKNFTKQLTLKYPDMPLNSKGNATGFADSIGRDLKAELGTKVLAIVPQIDDWICPVCYDMAWRPVSLGCCKSVICIRCVIDLQDRGIKKCPMCNAETVMQANGKNLDMDVMEFLEIYFPLEVKKRQKENEKAQLVRDYGEEFVKPGCTVM